MEKAPFKMSLLVCWKSGSGVNSTLGSKWRLPSVLFLRLVVVRNYPWYLIIVVIFTGFGRAKTWRDALKSLFEIAIQATKEGEFLWGRGFSLCNTVVLKINCKPCWVLKKSYRIALFSILLLFNLIRICWDWRDQNDKLKYSKVHEINT